MEIPEIMWHHGTCDNCSLKNILVLHLGYDKQKEGRDYRLCVKCLHDNWDKIMEYYNEFENLKRHDWRTKR